MHKEHWRIPQALVEQRLPESNDYYQHRERVLERFEELFIVTQSMQ